jgi:hypothetical protein
MPAMDEFLSIRNPEDEYDLFEDILVKVKFGKLSRADEHAQLRRITAAVMVAVIKAIEEKSNASP